MATRPMRRPNRRWPHSHQNICWNSPIDMPAFCSLYSAVCWYLANRLAQASSLIGGRAPLIGSHSVIDRPLSVSRVAPPISIMA